MIDVKDLWVGYGSRIVLRDITFSVKKGEVIGLLGTNGAGKSTLLKCLAGMLRQRSGGIFLDEKDITEQAAWQRSRRGLVLVPEGQQSFPSMTVWENLWIGAQSASMSEREFMAGVEDVFNVFPRLAERRNQAAGTLSGGERQMLAMGRATIARPRILMLDEPSHGLSPKLVEQIADIVQQIAKTTIVLVAEQNLLIPQRCASKVLVLENSEIVLRGATAEVMGSDLVTTTYLGM
jgi:branched-chain amino acid transport system ATP-binding protein